MSLWPPTSELQAAQDALARAICDFRKTKTVRSAFDIGDPNLAFFELKNCFDAPQSILFRGAIRWCRGSGPRLGAAWPRLAGGQMPGPVFEQVDKFGAGSR